MAAAQYKKGGTMIKVEQLTKIYRTEEVETSALGGIDLQVQPGEFLAITGPSGCGKSTLLNLLGLLDRATAGRYFFLDQDVSRLAEREWVGLRKRHIGFVFQSFNLIDELTIRENVELPLAYLGIPGGKRRQAVSEVLDQVRLTARRNHFPQQLSGGQQQRAAVARAVVARPRLILADEPTGNLDSQNGEEVMNLLSELNGEGTTIVMVTHSPDYARMARRVVKLFDGHIAAEQGTETDRIPMVDLRREAGPASEARGVRKAGPVGEARRSPEGDRPRSADRLHGAGRTTEADHV